MSIKTLESELTAAGWSSFKNALKNADACLYKRYQNHEVCRSNKSGGKQVEIYLYDMSKFHRDKRILSAAVHVSGNLGDRWVDFSAYGNHDPTVAELEKIAERLLTVWDFAVKQENQ